MTQGIILRKSILLADDQQDVRQSIKMLLAVDEHKVTEATDGAEALECFRQGRFDLVITDFLMPKMKGNELALKIKQLAPSQPILMVTAHAERLSDARNPVDAILNKPFTLDELRQTIARLLKP
jgi:CheY-like chemotaxis protein